VCVCVCVSVCASSSRCYYDALLATHRGTARQGAEYFAAHVSALDADAHAPVNTPEAVKAWQSVVVTCMADLTEVRTAASPQGRDYRRAEQAGARARAGLEQLRNATAAMALGIVQLQEKEKGDQGGAELSKNLSEIVRLTAFLGGLFPSLTRPLDSRKDYVHSFSSSALDEVLLFASKASKTSGMRRQALTREAGKHFEALTNAPTPLPCVQAVASELLSLSLSGCLCAWGHCAYGLGLLACLCQTS
jgi:hypothetical protein